MAGKVQEISLMLSGEPCDRAACWQHHVLRPLLRATPTSAISALSYPDLLYPIMCYVLRSEPPQHPLLSYPGRERGEDDTNFERQSALFALAVADVLMVNIWSIEIGREHGSGKPLLRTIFQVRFIHARF